MVEILARGFERNAKNKLLTVISISLTINTQKNETKIK